MNMFDNVSSENDHRSKMIFTGAELLTLGRRVNEHIDRAAILSTEWSCHPNRIFISPGNSFNAKYFIRFLSSKLPMPNQSSKTYVPSIRSRDDQLISQDRRFEVKIVGEEHNVNEILDKLTDIEFFRLLQIEPEKRLETLTYQYNTFIKPLEGVTVDTLCKLNVDDVQAGFPYEVYIETLDDVASDVENKHNDAVKTVKNEDILGLLKTCGIIVIDVSRDVTALTNGRKIFRSFKKEIVKAFSRGKANTLVSKNKRLIVVISTVMTWAGVNKQRTISEKDVGNRLPTAEFMNHYEFELEVLAVNQTKDLKEIIKTIIVWSGVTYGFEQDLLTFAFDLACKNNKNNIFPIPKSQNHIPVIHVENLARLIHKIISRDYKTKCNYIVAIESPIKTLKHIITALGETCAVQMPMSVSLDTFIDNYELTGIHKQMVSADVKVNSSIDRMWPDFEWYDSCKSSMVFKMKSLVEAYRRERKIKSTVKLLVLGPPASGKTTLASRLAQYYNSTHIQPKEITQNYIHKIQEELVRLQQRTLSVDSLNDQTTDVSKIDPLKVKLMSELHQKLDELRLSRDANNGLLGDIHLIPLINERLLNSKRGYVLDGYPTTVEQAKQIFNDISSLQQIDINRLPELTVCLKQKLHYSEPELSGISTPLAANNEKKGLMYSEISASSDRFNILTKSIKTIVNKSIYSNSRTTEKSEHLIWNHQNYENLLKMLNNYYVPMKMIDSPFSPTDFDINRIKSPKTDLAYEQLLNIVIKEIELDQNNELLNNIVKLKNTSLITEKTNSKNNNKKDEGEEFKKKMIMLEEFEKIVTNFEHIETISTEEYLMKYVTPILTKLITEVAKMRPKNPINFLAAKALKENSEGLFDCPGYSIKSKNVQILLECMFQNINDYDGDINFNSEPLIEFLTMHGEVAKDRGEESIDTH